MSFVSEVLYWINHNSWSLFAYYAIGLFTAAGVMAIHLRAHPRLPRYMALLSVGAFLAGLGSLLAGVQAGDDPLYPASVVLPWARLCWWAATTCLLAVCMLYIGRSHPKTY